MTSNSDNTTNSPASSGSNQTDDLATFLGNDNFNLCTSTTSTSDVPPGASSDANVGRAFDAGSTSGVPTSASSDANVGRAIDVASTSDVPTGASSDADVGRAIDVASTSGVPTSASSDANVGRAFDVASTSNLAAAPFAADHILLRSVFSAPTTSHGTAARSDLRAGGDAPPNFPTRATPPWLVALVASLSAPTFRTGLAAPPRLAGNVAATVPSDITSSDSSSDEDSTES